jgi:hypothetical protein
MTQQSLSFVFQILALICFAISGLSLTIPKPPRRAWTWFSWAWFCVVLSFMITGNFGAWLHPIQRSGQLLWHAVSHLFA